MFRAKPRPGCLRLFRPGSMLADFILVYWPEAAVRAALPVGGELLQEARSRTIRVDGKDVLRVDYGWAAGAPWNGTLRYSNVAWGYEIEVQSSELRRRADQLSELPPWGSPRLSASARRRWPVPSLPVRAG